MVVEQNATRGPAPNAYTNVAQALDLSAYAWFENGLPGSGANGLPQSRSISATAGADTLNFLLQPYGNNQGLVNNALRLTAASPTGTLTLQTPSMFSQLALLGFSTESFGPQTGNVQLLFLDGTTSLYPGAFSVPDWFTATANVAFQAGGRVSVADGFYDALGSANPRLYYSLIGLTPADQAKTLAAIQVTRGPNGFSYVAGVSGAGAAVPEPSGVALLVLGLAGLPVLVRRVRARAAR